jgi:PAS domain S-box-containing protein
MPVEAGSQKQISRAHAFNIIASAMDAIITIDSDQRIILFNAAAEKMFRCRAADAMGRHIEQFVPGRFRRMHREHVQKFGETSVTRRAMGQMGTIFGCRADGEEFPIEGSISHTDAGKQKLYTVILRDITERRRTEEALREQAALLQQAQDAILIRDLNDKILFWNKSAERVYGWTAEEALGESARELLYASDAAELDIAKAELIEHGEWKGEFHHTTKTGSQVVSLASLTLLRDIEGNPKSILAINTDITERKKLEAQFLRAQRMESIGTLAGGVAHDLANLLSPIVMSIGLLRMMVQNEECHKILSVIESNAERGGQLVKQVLSFAKGVEGERVLLQPSPLIKEIVKILGETLPRSIAIEERVPAHLPTLTGDSTQIHQILMNLCVNARDAMPLGGRLTIAAEELEIDENYARMNLEARPGNYVSISVSDSGEGIPPVLLDRIFEPFFTTKEHGKGTGLGLSTVLSIVKSHDGFINVYSEVGKGTRFTVYLPTAKPEGTAATAPEKAEVRVGRGELILVVDDEAPIRDITRTTLEARGYKVETASDGTEAIAIFAQRKDEITAVLTDVMMPFMDGPATIRALRRLDPDVKVIVSSGLDENKNFECAALGPSAFLSKPYTADRLLEALGTVLEDCRTLPSGVR